MMEIIIVFSIIAFIWYIYITQVSSDLQREIDLHKNAGIKLAYNKIRDTINSCETIDHIITTRQFLNNFTRIYPDETIRYYELLDFYRMKFIKIMK